MRLHRHQWKRYELTARLPLQSTVTFSPFDARISERHWGNLIAVRKQCQCGKDKYVSERREWDREVETVKA